MSYSSKIADRIGKYHAALSTRLEVYEKLSLPPHLGDSDAAKAAMLDRWLSDRGLKNESNLFAKGSYSVLCALKLISADAPAQVKTEQEKEHAKKLEALQAPIREQALQIAEKWRIEAIEEEDTLKLRKHVIASLKSLEDTVRLTGKLFELGIVEGETPLIGKEK